MGSEKYNTLLSYRTQTSRLLAIVLLHAFILVRTLLYATSTLVPLSALRSITLIWRRCFLMLSVVLRIPVPVLVNYLHVSPFLDLLSQKVSLTWLATFHRISVHLPHLFPKLAGPITPHGTRARPQWSLRPIVAFKWPGGFDGTQLSPSAGRPNWNFQHVISCAGHYIISIEYWVLPLSLVAPSTLQLLAGPGTPIQ